MSSNETQIKAAESRVKSTKELFDRFQEPGALYRGKPFWSWNGKLDKEELLRQVHVMHEMGFGGFFMHSRTGLVTEYMGEEWFEYINACADEAEKLGMEAWLYDEDRWPSGTAGGMVTVDPELRMRFMKLEIVAAAEFQWTADLLAAFSCKLDGISYTDCRQLTEDTSAAIDPAYSVLKFTVVEMEKDSFYNGYTYVDTMSRKATDVFIEMTHEKYKTHSGDKFGKSIKGIFTDEPHRGALFDSFGGEGGGYRAPWTFALFEEFERAFGYALPPLLPELFLQPEGRAISQVKWHYVELLQRLFIDNFAKPIDEWCRANQLILTGHILHEDSLTAQTSMSGSMMRYYEHMEYPGIDVLTEGNRCFWAAKQLQSAARQLGREWLLSELYGCTGWQMSLEAHKSVGDWQALFGINLRCHHLSWYTMEGEAKRDYPASILHQSTWWREYNYVESYFSRLGLVLNQGKPVCDVLVLNPVESVWAQVHVNGSQFLSPTSPAVQKLESSYSSLFHWLSGSQIDFDYGDEEMISRLAAVEHNDKGEVLLRVGQALYRAVIVSGMTTIRSTSLALLQQFVAAGGKVIFTGVFPEYVDARPSTGAADLAAQANVVPFGESSVVAACRAVLPWYALAIAADSGQVIEDIFCQVRQTDDSLIVVFLNVNREKSYDRVKIKLNNNGFVQRWNCTTGERHAVDARNDDDVLEFIESFPPSGERVYVITEVQEQQVELAVLELHQKLHAWEGPFAYSLSEPNVCVLDRASFRFNGGEWQASQEILKVDREIRSLSGLPYRGGSMVQPWYAQKTAFEPKGKLELSFEFGIAVMPLAPVELVLETPQHFTIYVNNQQVAEDTRGLWWIDTCFKRIMLPEGSLSTGTNTIRLETDFNESIQLEAIYLIGDFGVAVDSVNRSLIAKAEQIRLGDLTGQGLPFYSGIVTYQLDAQVLAGGQSGILKLQSFDAACVKVRCGDEAGAVIAWQPYEAPVSIPAGGSQTLALDVILSRRNTFGPLHLVPKESIAYGPDHWLSEGEAFSDGYQLYRSGLQSAPELYVVKE